MHANEREPQGPIYLYKHVHGERVRKGRKAEREIYIGRDKERQESKQDGEGKDAGKEKGGLKEGYDGDGDRGGSDGLVGRNWKRGSLVL